MEPITRKEIYLNQIAKNTGGSGGDTGLTPITREEHYFDAIVKNTASGGGGGSSLPAVTAADNGNVLSVVNGEWDKAAPSGGGSITDIADALITFTYDMTGEEDGVTAYEIVKGDFATVYAKAMRGDFILVLCVETSIDSSGIYLYSYSATVSADPETPVLYLTTPTTWFLAWDAEGIHEG